VENAATYRKQAAEAREIAEKMTDPADKAAWLRVADQYDKLAGNAEERDQR